MDTEKIQDESPLGDAALRRTFPLWQLLIAAALAHLVTVLLLSPGIFLGGGESSDPGDLLQRAREKAGEGAFKEAQRYYQLIVNQKPSIPQVFLEAERELPQVRLKALEQERRQAQDSPAPPEDQAVPDAGEPPDAPAPVSGDGTSGEGEGGEEVDLPDLPDLGGGF